jgi:hypothetical protein
MLKNHHQENSLSTLSLKAYVATEVMFRQFHQKHEVVIGHVASMMMFAFVFGVLFIGFDAFASQSNLTVLNFDAATTELKATLIGKIAKTAQLVGVVGGGLVSIPARSLKPLGGGVVLAFGMYLAEKLFT